MAGICQICLLGLVILSSFLTGTTGYTDVISSSGEKVSLPCNNALSGCTSTTWNYNKNSTSNVVELFAGGIKMNNIERRERLSLGSDCSLNIYKTTEEDHGFYTCRQYVNGYEHGTAESVLLHVLRVSSSSAQTEMRSDSPVTLSCQLFLYENSCDTLFHTQGIQLVWENQDGVNLHTDSRYQISSQGQCISTLTTKLLNEDNNKEWRCLLKNSKETKTSASYTVRFRGSKTNTNTVIPVTTINKTTTNASETEGSKTCVSLYRVIVKITVFVAPTVILLQIICAGRAGNRRNAHPEDTVISTIYK